MRLYIVRHAEPDYPNNTITPSGHLEARALARRFAHQGLDRIYISPIKFLVTNVWKVPFFLYINNSSLFDIEKQVLCQLVHQLISI